jgi:SAM-dependent methyltransferase
LQLLRRVARRFVGPLLSQERVDAHGELIIPRGLIAAKARLNQSLAEAGWAPPWTLTPEECRTYWTSRAEGETNAPSQYATRERSITDFQASFWSPEVSPANSILELGPNAGANLQRLFELGYHDLAGIEINSSAVKAMHEYFPQLASVAKITVGALEDVLPQLPSKSVDVIFSLGVLFHVHPKSRSIFKELVRIARNHLCVVENEFAAGLYVFPRNYARVFGALGCRELRSTFITPGLGPKKGLGTTIRLFAVPDANG